jgi:hypothetical protein
MCRRIRPANLHIHKRADGALFGSPRDQFTKSNEAVRAGLGRINAAVPALVTWNVQQPWCWKGGGDGGGGGGSSSAAGADAGAGAAWVGE